MKTYVLKEGDWSSFIQKEILSICETKKDSGYIFALVGELGSGKTTFSKTFLKELGVKQHVQSPTFSIINSYDISFGNFTKVFHIDVYRIDDIEELEVLHIDEILSNPQHVVVIEWADKMKAHIPKGSVWINFEHQDVDTRKVILDKDSK